VEGVIGDTTAKVYYYHTDHVGSIRKITNSAGAVVWDANYVAFGSQYNQSGSITELHSFTGKELDPDTGLYYFNARWYDAELGRFVSEDPGNDPNNPNLYGYCSNNPLIFTDPTGKIYQQDAMWLNEMDLKYDIPNYLMDNICFNMEKYGFDKATDFGFGLYEIQLGHGDLAEETGLWKWEATPDVAALGKETGVKYDVGVFVKLKVRHNNKNC
jgi:RHS repeat-associated protein